jgi:F0F1-type ATP synthase assembly protein I
MSNEGEGLPKAPDLPDTSDLDHRLKQLGKSSQGLQEQKKATEEELEKKRKTEQQDALGLGRGLQIAYAIIGFPVLGFCTGLALDHFLGTGYWKGFIGLGGSVLAVITALILIKQANANL